MFNAFIFDLDDNLIQTVELDQFRGGGNVGARSDDYTDLLKGRCATLARPYLISLQFLLDLREKFPRSKFCVFTRSPRIYALTLLDFFYKGFVWDAVIAYEDVKRTKPDPEGIIKALETANADGSWAPETFVIIGDSESDIGAGYRAGISTILYGAGWPNKMSKENFRANNLMPDANVKTEQSLLSAISDLSSRLPILEAKIAGCTPTAVRTLKISHINPLASEKTQNTSYPRVGVITLGRFFSGTLEFRKERHELTKQILLHKEATKFPKEWIDSIKMVIEKLLSESGHYLECLLGERKITITCIPHKLGRPARLEALINQLSEAYSPRAGSKFDRSFSPVTFIYDSGARSHHKGQLGKIARFENVKANLRKNPAASVQRNVIFVLDDVVTTGSTLYYAEAILYAAGAAKVYSIALAQAIGDHFTD